MTIFDVPAHKLVDLLDSELRELLARLCEAERELQGGHRNDVHWGGAQTTPDGGLDVVIEADGLFSPIGYLQRPKVGIQVKKDDLLPAAIKNEMRAKGALRPTISALAAASGSYLIASAAANCAKETMIAAREAAMREAVGDDPNGLNLHLAFVDRNALARWASAHHSVVAWLRTRLGLPTLRGWKAHGQWSSTPKDADDGLIIEDGLVFRFPDGSVVRSLPEALVKIADLVTSGEKAVRLAGLSGIGKSRIVQALFENTLQSKALPASQAIYTDVGDKPDPTPREMLQELIQRGKPAVMVVDNCPPETHTALAQELAKHRGSVRLITVEYDVQTDRPAETDVVKVEAEGVQILKALLQRRYPNLNEIDASRLADLAHGNARLGLALADAAPRTGSLSSFDDKVLFQRLFWQRSEADSGLEQSAEVLSLVYSFDKEGKERPNELELLASIIDVPRKTLYRHAGVIQQRGLAQARGRWRAVLPHALANRLAESCLRSVPPDNIVAAFSPSRRMQRSLARRLSYLHDLEAARTIVSSWMQSGGPLHGSGADEDLLEIVCHLAPQETLELIDAKMQIAGSDLADGIRADPIVRILARLAYDEGHFSPVCERLARMAAAFPRSRNNSEGALKSLFQLYLSGTAARCAARMDVVSRFLGDADEEKRKIAVALLQSALRTGHFSSFGHLYDDARPAPYGWMPKGEETVAWFKAWLGLAMSAALHGHPTIRDDARHVIAVAAGSLWQRVPAIRGEVVEAIRQLHTVKPFYEARAALLSDMALWKRRKDTLPKDDLRHLQEAVDTMAPTDLAGRARQEIARRDRHAIDYDHDDHNAAMQLKARQIVDLGRELGANLAVLAGVCEELLQSEGYQLHLIGTGLAEATKEPEATWAVLRETYVRLGDLARQPRVLATYLHELDRQSPVVAEQFRAEALKTPALRRVYGMLLPTGPLSAAKFEIAIELGRDAGCDPWLLCLLLSDSSREMSDANRVRLIESFLHRPNGAKWALVGLSDAVLHEDERTWSGELIDIATELVSLCIKSDELQANDGYNLVRLATKCMRSNARTASDKILTAVAARAETRHGSIFDVRRVLQVVAEVAPVAFLDWLESQTAVQLRLDLHDSDEPSPLASITQAAMLEWCGQRTERWGFLAAILPPFQHERDEDGEKRGRLTPAAKAFLNAAPDPEMVLVHFFQNVPPMRWSGSRAAIMRRRLEAFLALSEHPNEAVSSALLRLSEPLRNAIKEEEAREATWDVERDQRFEH